MISTLRQYIRTYRLSLVCSVLGLTLLVGVLAACGSNGTTGSGNPTATPPTQTQNCGSLHTLRLGIVPADQSRVQQVENCFAQAYQQCHPATLVYTLSSLDSGTVHTFSLKNANGKCTVSDAVGSFIAPRPPHPIGNYTCSGVSLQANGLLISSCGSLGDILIPPATAH